MAEIDGMPVGMVHHFRLDVDDDPSPDPIYRAFGELEALAVGHWYVSNMFVDPRRRGIGRLMLDHAHEAGRAKRCAALSLLVFSGNETARTFYTSLGFETMAARSIPAHPFIRGSGELLLLSRSPL